MRYEEEEKLLKSLASASFRITNIFSTGIALSPHDWLILCWSALYSCLCPSAAHISAQWGHLSLWQSLSDSRVVRFSPPTNRCCFHLYTIPGNDASHVLHCRALSFSFPIPTLSFLQYQPELITANLKATSQLSCSCSPALHSMILCTALPLRSLE